MKVWKSILSCEVRSFDIEILLNFDEISKNFGEISKTIEISKNLNRYQKVRKISKWFQNFCFENEDRIEIGPYK